MCWRLILTRRWNCGRVSAKSAEIGSDLAEKFGAAADDERGAHDAGRSRHLIDAPEFEDGALDASCAIKLQPCPTN